MTRIPDPQCAPADEEHPDLRRNFASLSLNVIFQRIGWIFKTESVIMPGFVESLTPSGAIRGVLPLISRFGQSIPQLYAAHLVGPLARKKPVFLAFAFLQVIVWGVLALGLFLMPSSRSRGPLILFLVCYAVHWITYGVTGLLWGTLQGKLIPPRRRGRLLAVSSVIGCAGAIIAAYFLMTAWLPAGGERYDLIFAATASCFLIAVLAVTRLKERPVPGSNDVRFSGFLADSIRAIRRDANFRLFLVVVALSYASMLVFPHYAVFGLRRLGLRPASFVSFVIAQNLVNALGSLFVGLFADRRGNRRALSFVSILLSSAPLMAIGIAQLPMAIARPCYTLVFACIGFSPVRMRIVSNYALEITSSDRHPQYLSILNIVQSSLVLFSPLVGLAIDRLSFEFVFVVCSGIMAVGAGLTFRLVEPREGRA